MGQIYIPVLNWFLLAACVVLVCSVQSITEVGNAYGNYDSLVILKLPSSGRCFILLPSIVNLVNDYKIAIRIMSCNVLHMLLCRKEESF